MSHPGASCKLFPFLRLNSLTLDARQSRFHDLPPPNINVFASGLTEPASLLWLKIDLSPVWENTTAVVETSDIAEFASEL